jgi:hypothetical protein
MCDVDAVRKVLSCQWHGVQSLSIFRAMKTLSMRFSCAVALLLVATVAKPGAAIVGEELAVLQAMAAIITQDAPRPYQRLYFESEFEGAPNVASALDNPDRNKFCGLSRAEALQLVYELETVTAKRVEFDKAIAESAGLKLGHKKNSRFPYVVLSRAVFGPGSQHAWVAVELNGSSGAVMRLDKVGGEWKKTDRCGGWIKAED